MLVKVITLIVQELIAPHYGCRLFSISVRDQAVPSRDFHRPREKKREGEINYPPVITG